MTLKDYYDKLPEEEKTDFRNRVLNKTKRNIVTFYRWVNDVNRPGYTDQKTIARMAGIPVKEMFPEKATA
jgi:hypothetical protein